MPTINRATARTLALTTLAAIALSGCGDADPKANADAPAAASSHPASATAPPSETPAAPKLSTRGVTPLEKHRGAIGKPWSKAPRPQFIPEMTLSAQTPSMERAVAALEGAGIPLALERGPKAADELKALLDAESIVSVARYTARSGAQVGYSILVEFDDERTATDQAKVLGTTRQSHLTGDAVIVRMGSVVGSYMPAPGRPDRAIAFVETLQGLSE